MSKYFQAKEFESRDGSVSPYPLVVQEQLYTLLDLIREEFGKPIIVNSGYRSPAHNMKVGGVPNSYHVLGMAADIRPKNLNDLPRLQHLADSINFNGGVGFYDTFVHVDVRPMRARWDMRKKK